MDYAIDRNNLRVGACLRDYTLCFWEKADKFKYEKTIQLIDDDITEKNEKVKVKKESKRIVVTELGNQVLEYLAKNFMDVAVISNINDYSNLLKYCFKLK